MAIRDLRIDGQPENNTGVKKLRVGVLGMGYYWLIPACCAFELSRWPSSTTPC